MKKYILIVCLAVLCGEVISAQESSNGQISISAVQPEYKNIPEEARANLETKMQRMISANGLASSDADRFIMTARVDITTREINSNGFVLQKMEITFIVGDVIEEKIYGMTTINTMGVGETDCKSFIKAFQNIKPSNPKFQQMLEDAKNGIVDYYQNNCGKIIQDADRMNGQQQYGEAIALLVSVPNVCPDCYSKCQQKAIEIYNTQIDIEGRQLIQQAKAAWNVKQDYDGAEKALEILSRVNPNAACREEADIFMKTINEKLRKDEAAKAAAEAAKAATEAARRKAEWEFKLRQYEDKYALEVQKQADKAAILNTFANRFGKIDIGIKREKAFKFGASSK